MKYNFSILKIYYYNGSEQFQPEVQVKHAQLAEKAGFDGIFVSDHFHPWVDDLGASGFTLSTLGAIAQVTQKVSLMTGVICPLFRFHPGLVAQAAATLDRLSGGRFELGVGTGENINEGPLGYEFGSYQNRSERMEEALEIIRKLLQGEKLDFEGTYYKTKKAKLYSPPLHQIRIFMAAGGEKSVALALKKADGLITSVKDPSETLEKVVKVARADNPHFLIASSRWSIIAQNQDEAFEAIKPWRGLRVENRLEEIDPTILRENADQMSKEEILQRYALATNTAEIIQIYAPLVTNLQSDIVILQTTSIDQEKTIEMLGKEVVPELRKLA